MAELASEHEHFLSPPPSTTSAESVLTPMREKSVVGKCVFSPFAT